MKKREKERWGEKLRDVVMVKTVMDDSRSERGRGSRVGGRDGGSVRYE